MKCKFKKIGIGVILIFGIFVVIVIPAKSYQVGSLIIGSSAKASLPDYLKKSNWQIIKIGKNKLIFKIMSLEPVVRRSEFITHEIITVSYYPEDGIGISKKNVNYPSPKKGILINVLGLMLQKFLQEGFKIGEASSFIKISGIDAYKFELIKPTLSTEQLLKGYPPIRYAWHIVVWRKGWYLITYSNFDKACPGTHFSDFKILLSTLKFTD